MIKIINHIQAGHRSTGLRSWCVLLCGVIFISVGCSGNVFEGVSDDDSNDAKLEEARMALDDDDYGRAAQMLEQMLDWDPSDPQSTPKQDSRALAYLGNAYAGMAGLDTLDMLTIIDALDESGNSGSIDMVGLVLGDAEGDIAAADVGVKLGYLNRAIGSLDEIEDSFGSLTDDEIVQRGILAVARTSIIIADIILSDQGGGSTGSVRLTKAGIGALYSGTPEFDDDVNPTKLDYLSEDVSRINDATEVLGDNGSDNDLGEDFIEFRQDLDPDNDENITVDELEGYVGSMAGG